jgi:hypothetical protein
MTTSPDTSVDPRPVASTVFEDDFSSGLVDGTRWRTLTGPDGPVDDGVATTSANGVAVSPPGVNPATGQPAFTRDVGGPMAHLKWMVTTVDAFSAEGGELRVTFRAGTTRFGMAAQPYGPAVADHGDDLRLGAATLNVLDFETGMVFDFWLTETAAYPYYERIRTGPTSDYQAFGQLVRIPRTRGAVQEFSIAVDVAANTVRWYVDAAEVASVRSIGAPDPAWMTAMDHGGTPRAATPRQFQVGLGLLTLLDAVCPPSDVGLVDLGAGYVIPASFAGSGPTLFGQGVQLDIEHVLVERQ